MGTEVNRPRHRLIAMVALMQGDVVAIDDAWETGEAFVSALEREPEKSARCPCCEKLVVLCTKHYQLHEPGKPCVDCRRGE